MRYAFGKISHKHLALYGIKNKKDNNRVTIAIDDCPDWLGNGDRGVSSTDRSRTAAGRNDDGEAGAERMGSFAIGYRSASGNGDGRNIYGNKRPAIGRAVHNSTQ